MNNSSRRVDVTPSSTRRPARTIRPNTLHRSSLLEVGPVIKSPVTRPVTVPVDTARFEYMRSNAGGDPCDGAGLADRARTYCGVQAHKVLLATIARCITICEATVPRLPS